MQEVWYHPELNKTAELSLNTFSWDHQEYGNAWIFFNVKEKKYILRKMGWRFICKL